MRQWLGEAYKRPGIHQSQRIAAPFQGDRGVGLALFLASKIEFFTKIKTRKSSL